jgi:hypothetical protein
LQGHAISLKFKLRTKGYDSKRRREVFICHHAKSYMEIFSGIRNITSTIITDCPYKVVLRQNHKNDMLWSSTMTNDHNHSLDCHVKVPFTTEELQALAESRHAGITPHLHYATN